MLGFFRSRLERAVERACERSGFRARRRRATALVHAEGDELPGLIVDRFGDVARGPASDDRDEAARGARLEALWWRSAPTRIIDRTPAQTAKTEGSRPARASCGASVGRALTLKERGLAYRLPLELGQKTGFYFDQRALRARVEALARGKRVLDAYCFVGAFAMAAARGGASEVVAVDESAVALEAARECARANGLDARIDVREGRRADAPQEQAHGEGSTSCVVDPPRLAPTKRRARRGARRVLEARRARVPRDEAGRACSSSARARRRSTSAR